MTCAHELLRRAPAHMYDILSRYRTLELQKENISPRTNSYLADFFPAGSSHIGPAS